jgi:hypothetical protein
MSEENTIPTGGEELANALLETDWTYRRILIFVSIALCAAAVVWLAIWGEPTNVNIIVANGSILFMGTILAGYVVSASVDDHNCRKGVPFDPSDKTAWFYRRLLVFILVVGSAVLIGIIMGFGKDNKLVENIVEALILLAGSTTLSYVFGATFDDWAFSKAKVSGIFGRK